MRYLEELRKINLPIGEYAVFGSGVMAVRSIRENNDLDILVKESLWKRLSSAYGNNGISIDIGNLSFFRDWLPWFESTNNLIDKAEVINGVPYVKLDYLIEFKKKRGKLKDKKDLELIKKYLEENL